MPVQQSDPVPPPSPLSPTTSGDVVVAEARLVLQEPATQMDIQAPLPDLAAMTAGAVSAEMGEGQSEAAAMMDTAAGAGQDGYIYDAGQGAGRDWPADPSFPHQGP